MKAMGMLALIVFIGFIALTIMDVWVIYRYTVGPERQMAESAIGHLWNARRTLNLTLSGQEWVQAGEAISPLNGNPQCSYKGPFDVCKPDFDWDLMSDSFVSTGDFLIQLDLVADSFTEAQALQNNQKFIDEAVVHVQEAGNFEYGWNNWNAVTAGVAWFFLLIVVILLAAVALVHED